MYDSDLHDPDFTKLHGVNIRDFIINRLREHDNLCDAKIMSINNQSITIMPTKGIDQDENMWANHILQCLSIPKIPNVTII